MTEEIAKYEVSQKVKPLTAKEIKADVQLIQEVMKAVMVEGHHYGIIPGTFKPTLYKPGSEKLLSTFRIAAYPKKIIDLSTQDEVRYQVEVHGICQTTGALLGVGIGECSSNEKKYKWRKPVCEQEFNETPEDKRQIAWQSGKTAYQVKQVRTNPSDVANTILKMAKKRAQIDMTLTVTAASDIFEQDLEDMPEELRETTATVNRKTEQKQDYKQPQSKSGQQTASTASNEKDLRAEITRMLTEMDSTGTEFEIMLKTYSGFEGTNKDTGEKKWIDGKTKVEELSDAAVKVTYGKIKKAYEKHLESKINA
jgi:hypothetical protein